MGDLPWVEKYRPVELKDVVGNKDNLDRFQSIAKSGNCPHLLLCGPPGVGKTTTIHCLARELLGAKWSEGVLELNASDDRGISVVRTKIKNFATKKVSLPPGRQKIIILDEADSMTGAAQQALRRTMEIHSKTTRFALACNTSSKIIEAIQSRCAIVRFSRLDNRHILDRVQTIVKEENLKTTNKGLEALVFVANGDMRNAVNSLQATAAGFGIINDTNVFKVCDKPHPKHIESMLGFCVKGDITSAISIVHMLFREGYAATDLIGTIFRVSRGLDIPETLKYEFSKLIGQTHMCVLDGLGTELQLSGLCAKLCLLKT